MGLHCLHLTRDYHDSRATLEHFMEQILWEEENENESGLCVCNGRYFVVLDDAVDSTWNAWRAVVLR